jgi:SAM-dependent methyltransferase
MKLHIGCGTVYLKGYVNIDGAPDYIAEECPPELLAQNATEFDRYYKQGFGTLPGHVVADLRHNIMDRLPFPNGFVDEIVMYQILEHIPSYGMDRIVADISRVLKVGGALFVSVPDIKITARMLAEAETEEAEDWAIRLIHGTQRNKWSHHYCGFVPRTLKTLLFKHGFSRFDDLPSINCYPVIHLKAIKGDAQ